VRLRSISLLVTFALSLLAASLAADAQQAGKVYRIGFLGGSSPGAAAAFVEAWRSGLREAGYAEGRGVIIEWRWAEGRIERLPELAADLVRLKVDLIVAGGNDATAAAIRATRAIPIVMLASIDPVGSGFVASLARPGGNVTGTAYHTPEVAGKILAMLKEAVPETADVAVLLDRSYVGMRAYEAEADAAARALRITLRYVDVKTPDDLAKALGQVDRTRPSALYVVTTSAVRLGLPQVIEFAASKRLPAIYTAGDVVKLGGLMAYAASFTEIARRSAWYVDKVLKGAKPADLPVEQPMKFELVINLKTAKALGLTIPQSILIRADEVIQ